MNLLGSKRFNDGARAAAMFALFCAPVALAQTPVTVVEYYNKITASYFLRVEVAGGQDEKCIFTFDSISA